MKRKSFMESALFQTASYFILSMLSVTNMSQLVKAEVRDSFTRQYTQVQILAQFSENGQEREQLVQKANLLFNQGDFTGAEKVLRSLIKKFPESSYGHYQLGNVLFRQNKKEDAIKEYQKAISLNSKYALAYNAIGQVFASQQQWSEAIAEYQKALTINPEYGEALANLALALWEQGKHQDARASLEKALNIFKAQQRSDKVQQIENILRQINSRDDPTVS
ncbi:MAG: tetratricopeptide repeat protein [Spirirestis rafaelensis WJT71-NPBG6]|jgi:tetratricopeptide (TPR) repeat protein|nr:tetratricopeptide repeat protein [Spirirestis rafaelensis WJT71-NPBG6]